MSCMNAFGSLIQILFLCIFVEDFVLFYVLTVLTKQFSHIFLAQTVFSCTQLAKQKFSFIVCMKLSLLFTEQLEILAI